MSGFQQVDRMLKDDHLVENPIKNPMQSKVVVINLMIPTFFPIREASLGLCID